jgi:sporulation protein YlmC with PRC-barrel domain
MPLPDIDTVLEWRGRTVVDQNGDKIGKLEELYLDEETSRPEWAAVHTGLFGRRKTLVPLSQAAPDGDDLRVPYDAEHVKEAPNVDADDQLSQDEEAKLYDHYGLAYSRSESGTGLPEGETGAPAPAGPAGSAEEQDEREGGEVRAGAQAEGGEEIEVASERPRERVRLKRYLVTEEVTKTIPVTREEIRVEREPVESDG